MLTFVILHTVPFNRVLTFQKNMSAYRGRRSSNIAAVCAHDNPTIRRMFPKSKIVYLVFLISSIL